MENAENAEFFQFSLKKQAKFLDAVAESVENIEVFLNDLETIMWVKVKEIGILELGSVDMGECWKEGACQATIWSVDIITYFVSQQHHGGQVRVGAEGAAYLPD